MSIGDFVRDHLDAKVGRPAFKGPVVKVGMRDELAVVVLLDKEALEWIEDHLPPTDGFTKLLNKVLR